MLVLMKVVVDNLMLNYSDQGSGPAVVLLHGWGASLQSFAGLSKQLAGYRLIALDFPGFGASVKPADSWTVDDYARLVRNFLAKLKVDKVYCLIGHSFGGRVILKAVGQAYLQPERVVLLGSAGVKPTASSRQLAFQAAAKAGKQVTKLPGLKRLQTSLRRRLYEKSGSTDYLEAGAMRQIFLNVIGEDLQAEATKIKQPSLLIWGEDDDATPVSDGKLLQQAIAGSRLEVINSAGHYVYLDQPGQVAKLIKEFLQ